MDNSWGKNIQLLLTSPEAGRYLGMLDNTVTTVLFLGPKDAGGGTESHSTKES